MVVGRSEAGRKGEIEGCGRGGSWRREREKGCRSAIL